MDLTPLREVWGLPPIGELFHWLLFHLTLYHVLPWRISFTLLIFLQCQGSQNRWRKKNTCVHVVCLLLRENKKIIKPTEMFLNLPVYLLPVIHLVHCSYDLKKSIQILPSWKESCKETSPGAVCLYVWHECQLIGVDSDSVILWQPKRKPYIWVQRSKYPCNGLGILSASNLKNRKSLDK